jgi:hypothetical protein
VFRHHQNQELLGGPIFRHQLTPVLLAKWYQLVAPLSDIRTLLPKNTAFCTENGTINYKAAGPTSLLHDEQASLSRASDPIHKQASTWDSLSLLEIEVFTTEVKANGRYGKCKINPQLRGSSLR